MVFHFVGVIETNVKSSGMQITVIQIPQAVKFAEPTFKKIRKLNMELWANEWMKKSCKYNDTVLAT